MTAENLSNDVSLKEKVDSSQTDLALFARRVLRRSTQLGIAASLLLTAACQKVSAASAIPDSEPYATRTYTPDPSTAPTESPTFTATTTEIVVSEPTAEEVADFTPETAPERFIHFGHEWAKTTIEEAGEQIDVWKTTDEGMENVDMRFVTLYEHYIKDMFIEHTDLGRFHLYMTPESPFRMRFPVTEAEQIGETIINQYLLHEMGEEDAITAIRDGGEVWSVYGNIEKNILPHKFSANTHTSLYSEDGSERIGELISLRESSWAGAGPFLNKDGSVNFGYYYGTAHFENPLVAAPSWADSYEFVDIIAINIIGAGGLSEEIFRVPNYHPLAEYLDEVSNVEWLDSPTLVTSTPTP